MPSLAEAAESEPRREEGQVGEEGWIIRTSGSEDVDVSIHVLVYDKQTLSVKRTLATIPEQ